MRQLLQTALEFHDSVFHINDKNLSVYYFTRLVCQVSTLVTANVLVLHAAGRQASNAQCTHPELNMLARPSSKVPSPDERILTQDSNWAHMYLALCM